MLDFLSSVPNWFTALFVVLALLAIFVGYMWLTSKAYRDVVTAEGGYLMGEGYTPDGAPMVPPGGCGTVTGMRLKVVPEYTYGRTFDAEYGRMAAQEYGIRMAQAAQKSQMVADLASGAAQGKVAAAMEKESRLNTALNDTRVPNNGADSSESFQIGEDNSAVVGPAYFT